MQGHGMPCPYDAPHHGAGRTTIGRPPPCRARHAVPLPDTPGCYRLKHTTRVSVISRSANSIPSRPMPLSLVPPKGMTSSR